MATSSHASLSKSLLKCQFPSQLHPLGPQHRQLISSSYAWMTTPSLSQMPLSGDSHPKVGHPTVGSLVGPLASPSVSSLVGYPVSSSVGSPASSLMGPPVSSSLSSLSSSAWLMLSEQWHLGVPSLEFNSFELLLLTLSPSDSTCFITSSP